jgi:hypothetical protein
MDEEMSIYPTPFHLFSFRISTRTILLPNWSDLSSEKKKEIFRRYGEDMSRITPSINHEYMHKILLEVEGLLTSKFLDHIDKDVDNSQYLLTP